MSDVWFDDLTQEQAEADALYARPGLMVFVGRRERGGATDVMAGRKGDVPWFRAVHCVGGDHAARAAAIVALYKSR